MVGCGGGAYWRRSCPPDAVDEANKLANTLLLVPPLLVELVLLLQLPFRAVLACGSSMICGEFSGNSGL